MSAKPAASDGVRIRDGMLEVTRRVFSDPVL